MTQVKSVYKLLAISYRALICRLLRRVELPREQYDPLRMELFKAIARFSSGPRLVLLQLCRALVALAFQTMPDVWPNTVVSCIHTLRSTTQATPVRGEKGGVGEGGEKGGVGEGGRREEWGRGGRREEWGRGGEKGGGGRGGGEEWGGGGEGRREGGGIEEWLSGGLMYGTTQTGHLPT